MHQAFVEGLVQRNLNDEPIPFALVAHDGGTFLGTASVIASDLDARSQYTPWVAAFWVDPEHRSNGIGAALVRAGTDKAHALGFRSRLSLRVASQARFLRAARLASGRSRSNRVRARRIPVPVAGIARSASPPKPPSPDAATQVTNGAPKLPLPATD